MTAPLRRGDAIAVVGNPRPGSRTRAVAHRVLMALAATISEDSDPGDVLDLAELSEQHGAPLGADVPARWATPLAQLHAARLIVVATPVYKASYTGLLKSFLDQVAGGALAGRVAIPLVAPGSPAHTLAADVHLRPLLVELGASTPTPSLIVQGGDLDDPSAVIGEWLVTAAPLIRPLLAIADETAALTRH